MFENLQNLQGTGVESAFHGYKRHLHDSFEQQRNVKRRLVDNLTGLSLGSTTNNNTAFPTHQNNTTRSSTLFGTYSQDELRQHLKDPNKVYIGNIDQFLKDNPDQLDYIGKNINLGDLRRKGLDTLLVSCGLDLSKAWEKIMAQYSSNDYENKTVDDQIYKLIWQDYLAKYFSLIKYYDPLKVIWKRYVEWYNEKYHIVYSHPHIVELDNDGDDQMIDDTNVTNAIPSQFSDFAQNPDMDFIENDNELEELASHEQNLRDGMSSYGSYYYHEDDLSWNNNSNSNSNLQDPEIFNQQNGLFYNDDDVMMED